MQVFITDKSVIKLMKLNQRFPNTTKNQSKEILDDKFNSNGKLPNCRKSLFYNIDKLKIPVKNLKYLDPLEILNVFKNKIDLGCNIIDENIEDQKSQFSQNLKQKLFKQSMKSYSVAHSKNHSRNPSFIKRNFIKEVSGVSTPNKNINICNGFTPFKKIDVSDFANTFNTYEKNYNSNHKKKLQKNNKKINVVGSIDSYLENIHQLYYKKFFDEALNDSVDIFNKGYEMKKKNYEEFSDQAMDLEYMTIEHENETIKKSYAQLLLSLKSDYEKELTKTNQTINIQLNGLISDYRAVQVSEDVDIEEINEKFMENIILILK